MLGIGVRGDSGRLEFRLTKTRPGRSNADVSIHLAAEEYGTFLDLLDEATLWAFHAPHTAHESVNRLERFIRCHRALV